MFILGLTGGIATGKSTVSKILTKKKIPIIDADVIAREVVLPNSYGYNKVIKTFHKPDLNQNIITELNGPIDRSKLGELIFNDEIKRKQLNSILHPLIRLKMISQILSYYVRGEPLIVLDVPLLFESGIYRFTTKNLTIYCSPEIQLKRIMERDQLDESASQARIQSQMPISKKIEMANYSINNSTSLDQLETEVLDLLNKIYPSKFSTYFWLSLPVLILSLPLSFLLL